jgi:hypothetical protein
MKSGRGSCLWLEHLEDRLAPSLAVQSLGGTLFVSGLPTGNVLLTEAAPNAFRVMDGTANLGTYANVSNVSLSLTNHQGKSVTVNLNGNALAGDLFINEGLGATTSAVISATDVAGGRIGGSLTVVGGSGKEAVSPGFLPGAFGPTASTLSVGGNIIANLRSNLTPNVFNVFNTGIVLSGPPPTVTVGGSIRTTLVDVVGIGPHTTVGRDVTLAAASVETDGTLTLAGAVRGSVRAAFGTNPFGNTLDLTPTGAIGGGLQASMGDGPNLVTLEAGSTVGANAAVSSGSGSDTFAVAGQVFGSASFNGGEGDDSITLAATAGVAGSLTLTEGSGDDSISSSAAVSGALHVTLGNGTDTVTLANAPGGVLNWSSGSGNDSVTLGAAGANGQTWDVNMRFGAGNDTLTLAGGVPATPDSLTGFLDLGGPPGGNTFDPTGSLASGGWVVVAPFTLQNV